MPKKYKTLNLARQLRPGVILVDKWGNKRTVLKWIDADRVLLTHKNTLEPGSVHKWKTLVDMGDLIRQ